MNRNILTNSIFMLPLLFLGLGFVVPLLYLFTYGFYDGNGFVGFKNLILFFSDDNLLNTVINSITVGVITAVITTLIAFFYSLGICFTNIRFKNIWAGAMLIPILAPSMFGAISLTFLFGKQGILNFMLMGNSVYGIIGIVIASVLFTLPHAFVIIYPVMRTLDGRLYETAYTLKSSWFKIFRTITLPLMKYALFSAFAVAFILTLTDFGVPKVIGGKYNMLAIEVYKQVIGQQNFNMGAIVSIVMIVPSLIVILFEYLFIKKDYKKSLIATKFKPLSNSNRDKILTLILLVVVLLISIPFLMGIYVSVIKFFPYDLSFTLSKYNYDQVGGFGYEPLYNSIVVSFVVAIFGSFIIFVNAYLVNRYDNLKLVRKLLHNISVIPASIPGTSLGIAYIFFFNQADNILNNLYNTIWILMLVNVVHYYTVPYLSFVNSFKAMDNDIENVSSSLGVSKIKTFFRVIVPMNKLVLLDSIGYMFINSMTTISAVIFLYSADNLLSSVIVVDLDDSGETAYALSLCILIVIVNIIAKCLFYLLRKFLIK